MNGSTHRCWKLLDEIHELLPHEGELVGGRTGEGGYLFEIRSCRKKLKVAGKNEGARITRKVAQAIG